jgi:hypothetical protein
MTASGDAILSGRINNQSFLLNQSFLVDPALLCCNRRRRKNNCRSFTSLRFVQDDSLG